MTFSKFPDRLALLEGKDRERALAIRSDVPVFENEDNIDLLSYAILISEDFSSTSPIGRAADELLSRADEAIMLEEHWDNPDSDIRMDGATGICIHFPEERLDESYGALLMSGITSWDEFVSRQ